MRYALGFLATALGFAFVHLGSADTSFSDPAGDAVRSRDITAVTVSNTDAGVIMVRTAVQLSSGDALYVHLDTDDDRGTGNNLGVDRIIGIQVMPDGTVTPGVWDANRNAASGTIGFERSTDRVDLSFDRAAFGLRQRFAFQVHSSDFRGNAYGDWAPNQGIWAYELTGLTTQPAAWEVVISKPITVPQKALAGKRFTVSFRVTRSDTGLPVTNGEMTCKPSIAGKGLRHAETFKGGTARLSLTIPKKGKGKALKVRLTINAENQSATKIATFRVR